MAIQTTFAWQAKATSAGLNTRMKELSGPGFLSGGTITLVPGELQVRVALFSAISNDGMIVRDTAVSDLIDVTDNATIWICLVARHNVGGDPTAEFVALLDADYDDLEPEAAPYHLVVGKLVVPGGAAEITNAMIDYTVRTEIDKVHRSQFRGYLDDLAALAAVAAVVPSRLRDGDSYLVGETFDMHTWFDGAFHRAIDVDNAVKAHWYEIGRELTRRQSHSGVIRSGFVNGVADLNHTISTLLYNDGANISVGPIPAIINGQFIVLPKKPHAFDDKPEAGTRWDGLMLEVWRETVAAPDQEVFHTASEADTRTLTEVAATLSSGMLDAKATRDSDAVEVASIDLMSDGSYVRTMIRLAYFTDISVGTPDLSSGSTAFVGLDNQDNNPFELISSYQYAVGEPKSDTEGLYRGSFGVAIDGFSYAIPLLIFRRVSTETGDAEVMNRRDDDGCQQIFHVAPIVQPDLTDLQRRVSATENLMLGDTPDIYAALVSGAAGRHRQFSLPSGVLTGWGADITGAENTLAIPSMTVSILGRIMDVPETDVTLPDPPTVAGEYRSDLVTLEMRTVRYPKADYALAGLDYDPADAPTIVDAKGNTYRTVFTYRVVSVTDKIEIEAAMASASYSPAHTFHSADLQDPALWVRNFGTDSGYEYPYPNSRRHAIAIALVARRNTAAYDVNTNRNGTVDRPEGFTAETPTVFDICDMRQRVLMNTAEAEQSLAASWEALLQGRLRTHLTRHPLVSTVAGLAHLYSDGLSKTVGGASLPAGYTEFNTAVIALDGCKGIFSYADETQPVHFAISGAFDAGASEIGGFTHFVGGTKRNVTVAAADSGTGGAGFTRITVRAPLGGVFVLNPAGDPYVKVTGILDSLDALVNYDVSAGTLDTVVDGLRNCTEFSFDVENDFRMSTTRRIITVYVTYHGKGPDSADNFDVNAGLYACPDHLVRCIQSTTELGAGAVLTAPPMKKYTATFAGQVATFDLGDDRAVGFDFVRGNTGLSSAYVPETATNNGRGSVEAGELVITGVENSSNDHDIDLNSLFRDPVDSFVSTNDNMSVIVVKTATAHDGAATSLRTSIRPDEVKRWVECGRNSQSLIANIVWGVLQHAMVDGISTYYIPAANFVASFADGDTPLDSDDFVSPQSMFYLGARPDVDVFLWVNSRVPFAGNQQWKLIPHKIAGQSIWNITSSPCGGYLTLAIIVDVEDWNIDIEAVGDLRIVAKIWEPITVANRSGDDEAVWPTTNYLAVDYIGTPYQGAAAAQDNTLTTVQGFHGTVVAASDHVLLTSAGRVPLLRDINSVAVVTEQPSEVHQFIDPAAVFMRRLPTGSQGFNQGFDWYDYGAISSQLPVAERVWYDNGPSWRPGGMDMFRLLKHASGQSLFVGSTDSVIAESIMLHVPIGGAVAAFGEPGTVKLTPGMVIGNNTGFLNLLAVSRLYTPTGAATPSFYGRSRGVFLSYKKADVVTFAEAIAEGRVTLNLRGVADAARMAAGNGINGSFGLNLPGKPAGDTGTGVSPCGIVTPLLAKLTTTSFRHNVTGQPEETVSATWSRIGTISAYSYLINAKGPQGTSRKNLMMAVATRISNGTNTESIIERRPGEVFDIFYPLHRPVLRTME